MKKKWIIGTRGSGLALKQTGIVVERLKALYPHIEIEVKTIKTKGDTIWDRPLHLVGGKGLFVKEIEDAMVKGQIDLAVHSVKDMPTEMADGLTIGAILEREDPRDVFISHTYNGINELKPKATIGTSSLRRRSQLINIKRDINIVDIRGNVDTRIRKIAERQLDGIILAYAGVKRMGLQDKIKEILPVDVMVPPAGQGAIGIETKDNKDILELLRPLNHEKSLKEITIEREIQKGIGGGCQVPLGINASISGDRLTINIFLGKESGDIIIKEKYTGDVNKAEEMVEDIIKGLPHF
ncbi:MAG TPA: hydroxymethylbilane synthase [Syntrophorhabdaceae bacterium]|nr:hydroxymethylbilane synthase [Syntrophorhabdaceae bacterium]HOT41094.1 hydroxymethylbilane synthase [Syntrophorhabdaceae bacterium]HPC66203.1 hydroxymethylbilane synthase [Syntrophorhabdaceae bacterium]HQE79120.1 hydroxymethylbilane synthase [Syntrophorhabdaceae bacterium]HQK45600.1 hydroxymethylbilane synthase [Syntrophorhabdaceae bacterium]